LELLDNVESNDAKWCILTQFETTFFMLELLIYLEKQGPLITFILTLFETMFESWNYGDILKERDA